MTIANLEEQKAIFDAKMIVKPDLPLVESGAVSAFSGELIAVLKKQKKRIKDLEDRVKALEDA